MRFSYNWLQSFFEEKLPRPEELAELLTMKSFEVEEIVKSNNDYILDMDILPNRASDCLSHYGLAREIAALLKSEIPASPAGRRNPRQGRGSPWAAKSETNSKFKIQNSKLLTIEIQDKSLCPRYTAYVIEDVKITESPDWIKERLASMNQKAINNVVDITNYVMWELGQPLHAFDFDKIQGGSMSVRLSKQGEKLQTLDGTEHDLGEDSIIIEDAEQIIDLAGIKGGANTQIDDDTTRVIFQAAIFDPAHIRRTSQKLGVMTEASVRYMHGFDPNLPPQALERAIEILRETNPGAKIIQQIDIYLDPVKPKKIDLDIDYANALLGTYLSIREIRQIFERLGVKLEKGKVEVPTYRLDLNIKEDLVEEIGRIYGYENVTAEPPSARLITPRRNDQVFWRNKAREILAGFGFSEVYNYSLISSITHPPKLELANPVSEEFRYLRPALWPGILKNIALNQKFFDSAQIFEIGNVFSAEPKESEGLIFAIADKDPSRDEFYRLKGYLDEFFKKLGITDFYLDPALSDEEKECFAFLHPARRANIVVNGEKVGYIGEVHPKTSEDFNIKQRVFCAEIDFEKVVVAAVEEHIYEAPSKYPEVVRDIALLVPREVMVEEALNVIETAGGPLLRDTDLFDIYEGENLPEDKKNLAFHLIFQSDERTLTSQEVDTVMKKIYAALEDMTWELRE